MEWFSQNIWVLAEDLRLLKGQESLHVTRSRRRRKKNWIGWGPGPLGGSYERKVPAPWEVPSPMGRSTETERKLERRNTLIPASLQQPEQRNNYTDSECYHAHFLTWHSYATAGGSWVLEVGFGDQPEERAGVDCVETDWGGWNPMWPRWGFMWR